MTLLPTRLESGEEYATVGAILAADDRSHATIRILQWGNAALRVRALSLAQRDAVDRASLRADGSIDSVRQITETLRLGCVVPQFSAAQAEQLADLNGHILEQIARFILGLSVLDQDYIETVVQQLSGARPAAAPDTAEHDDAAPAPAVGGAAAPGV